MKQELQQQQIQREQYKRQQAKEQSQRIQNRQRQEIEKSERIAETKRQYRNNVIHQDYLRLLELIFIFNISKTSQFTFKNTSSRKSN